MRSKFSKATFLILVASIFSGCGAEKNGPRTQLTAIDPDSDPIALAPGATNGRGFSAIDLEKVKQVALPALTSAPASAGSLSVQRIPNRQVCPAGYTEECLNSTLLALGNSPILKWTTIGLEGSLQVVKGGKTKMKWKGSATQPSYGAGYTLKSSSFSESSVNMSLPITGAGGHLTLLSNYPAAAIGGFVTITDGSSFAGIAGGFAGISPQGYITGAFGCGFSSKSLDGVPIAECFAIPLSAIGW